jgi:hypothetical protein
VEDAEEEGTGRGQEVPDRLGHARERGGLSGVGRAQREQGERQADARPLPEPQKRHPERGCRASREQESQDARAAQEGRRREEAALGRAASGEYRREQRRRDADKLHERDDPSRLGRAQAVPL